MERMNECKDTNETKMTGRICRGVILRFWCTSVYFSVSLETLGRKPGSPGKLISLFGTVKCGESKK